MLKGHPKGLYVAFLTNMGERFGFYTMMGILVLFLQAKFNLSADKAGLTYSIFYFLIYALALVGGFIADRTQNYKGVVATGVIVMFAGYLLLAIPGMGFPVALLGLFAIAFGNGLFKGNLQALVGQMYDDPQYSGLRDTAFNIFYMGINIGAMFAPNAAYAIQKWWIGTKGFAYDPDLPSLCNQFVQGTLSDSAKLATLNELATKVSGEVVTDLGVFAKNYLEALSTGYNYAFGIASIAMLISLTCYIIFKRHLPEKKHVAAGGGAAAPQMDKTEEKKRLIALLFVFLVVIFFWMSFHQNGLTMTFFARDYTVKSVSPLTNLLFDIRSLLSLGLAAAGLVFALKPSSTGRERGLGAAAAVVFGYLAYYFYNSFCANYPNGKDINPVIFQHFNAFFVVFLTPVVIGIFAWLRSKKKEPSAPRKIGIGMIIAALGFVVLMVGSFGLPSQASLAGSPVPEAARVSSQWLVSSYLVLTFAELCLSPMGISFVSKVAPPRFQGLMQGCWLGATALGNQLLVVGSFFWTRVPVWGVWAIFIVCCLISAVVMFSLLKRIERVTS
ncbi:MAG: peptide MFS transporter [Holophagales bacterium]|jgi:POT family proton-dependent oligopeptide transporter|nr:peptide MFS transporter [Holophagales bacterium]